MDTFSGVDLLEWCRQHTMCHTHTHHIHTKHQQQHIIGARSTRCSCCCYECWLSTRRQECSRRGANTPAQELADSAPPQTTANSTGYQGGRKRQAYQQGCTCSPESQVSRHDTPGATWLEIGRIYICNVPQPNTPYIVLRGRVSPFRRQHVMCVDHTGCWRERPPVWSPVCRLLSQLMLL